VDRIIAITVYLPIAALITVAASALARRVTGVGAPPQPTSAWRVAEGSRLVGALLVAGPVASAAAMAGLSATGLLLVAEMGFAAAVVAAVLSRIGLRTAGGGDLAKLLGEDNMAAALTCLSQEVAAALIVAHAFAGSTLLSMVPGLAFAAVGWLCVHALVAALRFVTPWDDAEHLRDGNVAAAVAHSGLAIAIALLVSHATVGEFTDWGGAWRAFGETCAFGIVLVPVRIAVVQVLLLGGDWRWRGGALDQAVGRDRDIGAAALEAAGYVGTALALRAVL